MGSDGISSWMFAVDADPVPFFQGIEASSRKRLHWNRLIHFVRNPFAAIPSIMLGDAHSTSSREFRREHILEKMGFDLDQIDSPIERAAWSLIYWTRIVANQQPDLWFQVEQPKKLLEYLKEVRLIQDAIHIDLIAIPSSDTNAKKPYKGVIYKKPHLKPSDFSSMSEGCRLEVERYCAKYGYNYEIHDSRSASVEQKLSDKTCHVVPASDNYSISEEKRIISCIVSRRSVLGRVLNAYRMFIGGPIELDEIIYLFPLKLESGWLDRRLNAGPMDRLKLYVKSVLGRAIFVGSLVEIEDLKVGLGHTVMVRKGNFFSRSLGSLKYFVAKQIDLREFDIYRASSSKRE